ncbi:hypothetical protein MSSAC_1269 [Methanosarcina siciliae C2J]|uniref:Uncharacterized protein n=1 Tax=Methanosarcina siciliae C2J TaxID=1434118 RepID=A0A0E3PMZ5_9EURY|nr:hypothetical protein [Methanosarcina siciliae]AKB35859.1 hypothetical protein MSSAC_1269 [Methanosarcina siciliae C2J]
MGCKLANWPGIYRNQTLKKITWILIISLIVAPVIIGIFYIYKFGIDVPYWDQWDEVPIFLEKLSMSHLTIFDLIAQHNESRPFFPNIIMIALALISNYNVLFEMYFMYFVYCISFVILFHLYISDHLINKISCLKFIPISFFFFNLFQMSNMLFGVRIGQSMEIFGFISAVYLIDKSQEIDKKFLLSIVAAAISTFSFVAGLSTWAVCFIQILLQNRKQKTKKIIIWCTSAILVFYLYFYDYVKPGGHPSILYSFHNPSEGILVFFGSVGSSIVRDMLLSPVVGSLMLITLFFILFLNVNNLMLNKNGKWFSLILFSFLASFEIAVGRSGFGVESAIQQRYYLLTFWSVIGLYCVLLNYLDASSDSEYSFENKYVKGLRSQNKNNYNYLLTGVVVSLLFIGIATNFFTGLEYGKNTEDSREDMAYYLKTYDIQPDKNLESLYPDPSVVRQRAPFLKEYRLTVFSKNFNISGLDELKNSTLYSIDTVNGKNVDLNKDFIVIDKEMTDEIEISGWAVDSEENILASEVFITIDGEINIPSRYNLERKDVANHFKTKNFEDSGFKASFASSILEKGTHTLAIKVVSSDNNGYYKSEPVDFVVI